MTGHALRERAGGRPLHLAGCWCWNPAAAAAPPALPARRSWVARVLLAAGLVEEAPRADR